MVDMLAYEKSLLAQGYSLIGGIDEAGRGPLAGPVVVAGVIMPTNTESIIPEVNDSKKLSEKKREKLYPLILERAVEVRVAVIDEKVIDEINILNATKKGMLECIEGFQAVDAVLIDAVKLDTKTPTISIIHGDALSYNIAAASIVAKVTRDRMMKEYALKYPEYKFEKHKGYGTAEHIALLKQYAPSPIHRKTFITHFLDID